MATPINMDKVQKIYNGYYGRPADVNGQTFWADQLDAGQSVQGIIDAFGNSAEATALFAGQSNEAKVNNIYLQCFGREADVAGLNFYTNALATGTFTAQSIFLNIQDGATGTDATAVANKLIAGNSWTAALDTTPEIIAYSGTNAANAGRSFLAPVNDTAASLTTAVAGVDTAVANMVSGSVSTGTTFTLTTGVDTIIGTTSNDTIVGLVDGTTATNNTISAADTINGGGGTGDALNLAYQGGAVAGFPAASISNIETFNLRAVGTGAVTAVDLSLVPGLTSFNSDRSTQAVTATNLATGGSFGMIGNGAALNAALNVGYATATAPVTINISGGTLNTANAAKIAVTSNAHTAATINSTGAANAIDTVVLSAGATVTGLTVNAATNLTTGAITGFGGTTSKITVTGAAASVNLNTIEAATVKTIDAAGLTAGGVTATLNANTTFVLTGGAGNDVVTAGGVLATGALVDAAVGTADRLVITANAQLTTVTAPFYKNFEVLQANTGVTADVSQLAAGNTITGIRINDSAGEIVAVNGLSAAQAANVAIIAANDAIGAITLGLTGASIGGQIDTVQATLTTTNAAGAAQVSNLTGIVLTGVEKLGLVGTGTVAATTGAITLTTTAATSLDSITLTTVGAATVTVAAGHTGQNLSIDGSASSGALLLDGQLYPAATTTGLTLTGGSGKDVLLGSTSAVSRDNLVGGDNTDSLAGEGGTVASGGALFTVIGANTASDILTGGAGKDVFGISALGAVATPDSIVDLDLGTSNLAGQVDRIVIDGTSAVAAIIVTLSAAQQDAITAEADFTAAVNKAATYVATTGNTLATFTYGANTFLITNDVAAGAFNAAQDTVVKITGVTGTLDTTDIVWI